MDCDDWMYTPEPARKRKGRGRGRKARGRKRGKGEAPYQPTEAEMQGMKQGKSRNAANRLAKRQREMEARVESLNSSRKGIIRRCWRILKHLRLASSMTPGSNKRPNVIFETHSRSLTDVEIINGHTKLFSKATVLKDISTYLNGYSWLSDTVLVNLSSCLGTFSPSGDVKLTFQEAKVVLENSMIREFSNRLERLLVEDFFKHFKTKWSLDEDEFEAWVDREFPDETEQSDLESISIET